MRHKKRTSVLSRTTSERKALLSSLAISVIKYQSVKTTLAKAKEARKFVEKLITKAKEDTVHNRRLVAEYIVDRSIIKILFSKVAPLFKERNGGYTRVIHLGNRAGDGAQMAILELVDKYIVPTAAKKKAVVSKKAGKKAVEHTSDSKKSEARSEVSKHDDITEANKDLHKEKNKEVKRPQKRQEAHKGSWFKGLFGKRER